MRALAGILAAALVSCGRQVSEHVTADPIAVDARPPDATPLSDPMHTRLFVQGKIVDVRTATVARVLTTAPTPFETSNASIAFYTGNSGDLHAVDLDDGAERWTATLPTVPATSAVDAHALYLPLGRDLLVFDAQSGARTSSTFSAEVHDVAPFDGGAFVLVGDEEIAWIDRTTASVVRKVRSPFRVAGWRARLVVPIGGSGPCVVAQPSETMELACWDGSGALRLRRTFDLRKPGDPMRTSFFLLEVGDRWAVFGTAPFLHAMAPHRSVVVRIDDGVEVLRVDEMIASTVARADGSLEGAVTVMPNLSLLDLSGAVRWSAPPPGDDCASAFVRDERLFVLAHPSIAPGGRLFAFDRTTGKKLWTGDVDVLPIAHSAYRNASTLEFVADRVVLRVDESMEYGVQIFEPATGERLLSELGQR